MKFLERMTDRNAMLLLAAMTVLAFGPFISHGFVGLDDDYLIYQNPAVQSFTLRNLFHVFSTYDPQLYIPLTFVSYQLTALIFGMSAWVFHAGNLLLHVLNVLLVFKIIKKLSGNDLTAIITAALFAIHPLQTEAVLWASARKDVLSAFFALLTIHFYLRDSFRWSVLFFLLALLSKVSVILLPGVLLLIDGFQGRAFTRRMLTEKIPFFILSGVFAVIAIIGKAKLLVASNSVLSVLLPFRSTVFYIHKIFFPTGLSVIYPFSLEGGTLLSTFLLPITIVLVLLLLTGAMLLTGRHRSLALALALFFLFLAPSYTTFFKNGFLYYASDRYVYLASIGVFWLLAQAAVALPRKFAISLVAVVLLILLPRTWSQATTWSSTEALYRNVLAIYPDSVMARANLGYELNRQERFDEARAQYVAAIAADPQATIPYFNLAALEGKAGRMTSQVKLYTTIIDILQPHEVASTGDVQRFLWLMEKLEKLDRKADALKLLQKLTAIAPRVPEFHHELGIRLKAQRKLPEALQEFEAAAEHDSRNPLTYYNLAELYADGSRMTEALKALERGVALDPENEIAKRKLEQLRAINNS